MFFIFYRPPREQHAKVGVLDRLKRLDLPGLLLFFGSMVSLIFALQLGGSSGTWSKPAIVVLFTLFGVFLLLFAAYETWLGETATLPPRIAKNRTVLSASFFVLTIDAPYYAIAYFVSEHQRIPDAQCTESSQDAHLFPSGFTYITTRVWHSIDTTASRGTPLLATWWYIRQKDWIFCTSSYRFDNCYIRCLWPSLPTPTKFRSRYVDWLSIARRHRHRSWHAARSGYCPANAESGGHPARHSGGDVLPGFWSRHHGVSGAKCVFPASYWEP